MNPHETFQVFGCWQERQESAAELASRFLRFLSISSAALPSDTRWYGWTADEIFFDIRSDPEKLEAFIEEGLARHDDDGRPWPELGYSCIIPTLRGNPNDREPSAHARLSAGGNKQNEFKLFSDADRQDSTDPRLVTYDSMRTIMLAVAQAFEPDWCEVGPFKISDYFDIRVYNRSPMGLAWMIWFKPDLAALVTPPIYTDTIIERLTDGSLYMATSTEMFDCGNTTHLEQARAIHRQIDPLNYTVPFCGLNGRSPRVPPFPQL